MLRELLELKTCGARGVKLEFESEFYTDKSAFELSELVHRVDLDLCVKLGGASSITDIHKCKLFCANSIVAPMIESAYAVEKFLLSIKQVYGKAYPDLYLNIETKTAFDNLDEIVEKASKIKGFVLGRSDLKKSLGIDNANDDRIFEFCKKIDEISHKTGKNFILGGKINTNSLDFINKLEYLTQVETRKVIFDKDKLNGENIVKALKFELKCLSAKELKNKEDKDRIEFIKTSLLEK